MKQFSNSILSPITFLKTPEGEAQPLKKREDNKSIPVSGYIVIYLLLSSTALAGVFLKRESISEAMEKTKVFYLKYPTNILPIKTCFGHILLLLYT